jgi:hypothetical protein
VFVILTSHQSLWSLQKYWWVSSQWIVCVGDRMHATNGYVANEVVVGFSWCVTEWYVRYIHEKVADASSPSQSHTHMTIIAVFAFAFAFVICYTLSFFPLPSSFLYFLLYEFLVTLLACWYCHVNPSPWYVLISHTCVSLSLSLPFPFSPSSSPPPFP